MAKKKTQGGKKKRSEPTARFTAKQGQYLAYIHLYRKLHRRSPAEAEIARYFRVSPPSVHQMIVKLHKMGLITRELRVARSIRVAIPRDEIPPLDDDDEVVDIVPKSVNRDASRSARLYILRVAVISGPVPDEYRGKEISRTIQIRGDQTLERLHRAIFHSFDRFDEHFYEFQLGKKLYDPKGKRYVLPEILAQQRDDPTIAGDTTKIVLDSLSLEVDQPFGYLFDYGDEWWHQIDVQEIVAKAPRQAYPRVTKRVGKSPPQYMEED